MRQLATLTSHTQDNQPYSPASSLSSGISLYQRAGARISAVPARASARQLEALNSRAAASSQQRLELSARIFSRADGTRDHHVRVPQAAAATRLRRWQHGRMVSPAADKGEAETRGRDVTHVLGRGWRLHRVLADVLPRPKRGELVLLQRKRPRATSAGGRSRSTKSTRTATECTWSTTRTGQRSTAAKTSLTSRASASASTT